MKYVYCILKDTWPFLGSLLIAYMTYKLTLNSQRTISDYQKRQLTYSKLIGLRFPLQQIYVSRFEALVHSHYHEYKWKLRDCPKDSLDLQEAIRWMRLSEELVFKIVDIHKELNTCLGDIQLLFPKSSELDGLVNKIYYKKAPALVDVPAPKDEKELDQWKDNSIKELQTFINKEYAKLIDDIAAHLRTYLDKNK